MTGTVTYVINYMYRETSWINSYPWLLFSYQCKVYKKPVNIFDYIVGFSKMDWLIGVILLEHLI